MLTFGSELTFSVGIPQAQGPGNRPAKWQRVYPTSLEAERIDLTLGQTILALIWR